MKAFVFPLCYKLTDFCGQIDPESERIHRGILGLNWSVRSDSNYEAVSSDSKYDFFSWQTFSIFKTRNRCLWTSQNLLIIGISGFEIGKVLVGSQTKLIRIQLALEENLVLAGEENKKLGSLDRLKYFNRLKFVPRANLQDSPCLSFIASFRERPCTN